jgi:hypothetical protein
VTICNWHHFEKLLRGKNLEILRSGGGDPGREDQFVERNDFFAGTQQKMGSERRKMMVPKLSKNVTTNEEKKEKVIPTFPSIFDFFRKDPRHFCDS